MMSDTIDNPSIYDDDIGQLCHELSAHHISLTAGN